MGESGPPSPTGVPAAGGLATLAGVLAGAAAAYALGIEPRRLQVNSVRVPLAGLPRRLIAVHWTDLHGRDLSRLRWSGPDPDLVLFTGDLVTYPSDLGPAEATLRRLGEIWPTARGRFAVFGNHDRRVGRSRVGGLLVDAGYQVLDNRGLAWEGLWIAGTDDPHRGRPDLDAALAGAGRGVPVLLLTHSPEIFPRAAGAGVALALAGHTHGGQVRLPLVGPLFTASRLGRRYVAGMYREGGSHLFVSRGLGTVHLPVRCLCPPEIVSFELIPKEIG